MAFFRSSLFGTTEDQDYRSPLPPAKIKEEAIAVDVDVKPVVTQPPAVVPAEILPPRPISPAAPLVRPTAAAAIVGDVGLSQQSSIGSIPNVGSKHPSIGLSQPSIGSNQPTTVTPSQQPTGSGRENLDPIPANNRIFVDGRAYEVRYIDDVAVIERNGLPHRIYFVGTPRDVVVDGYAHTLAFGESKTITIDGQQHVIRFGAPSKELYMGEWLMEFFPI